MKSTLLIAAALAIPLLAVAAPADLVLDLETLWPNTDGNHWEYQQTNQLADWVYVGPDTTISTVGLRFSGTTTAYGGAVVQNLVEEPAALSALGTEASRLGIQPSLLKTLWMARPDLRPALAGVNATADFSTAGPQQVWEPLFLHGGAFDLNADEIVTWRTSLEVGKSWLFLVSHITQYGDTFQIQLIPDLAPDVFLTGTVTGFEDVTVPAGSFQNCLRVDYVLDLGTAICTSESGPDSLGTYRGQTTGWVDYAPGVGPVRSEESLRFHDVVGDCGVVPDEVAQRIVLELTTSTVPARPTTWGRMKTKYLPGAAAGRP